MQKKSLKIFNTRVKIIHGENIIDSNITGKEIDILLKIKTRNLEIQELLSELDSLKVSEDEYEKKIDKVLIDLLNEKEPDPKQFNNISISLDSIDELFDDFDDNPEIYETRTLSDDFLDAVKLRYRFSSKKIRIILLAPFSNSLKKNEKIIIDRIREQLHVKKKDIIKETIQNLIMSLIYFGVGIFTLLNITLIRTFIETIFKSLNGIITEIPLIFGWVGLWEGITHLVDFVFDITKSNNFIGKIEKAEFWIKYY